MKATVLANEKGTRLFPLTGMIPIAPTEDKPVPQHVFELPARTGGGEAHVNVYHEPRSF